MFNKPYLKSLSIEATNRCNLKCAMCVSHGAQLYQGQADSHPAFIDMDFFKSIIEQYVGIDKGKAKYVSPQFQGEPLLHPRFLSLCEFLEKKKVRFGFATNASLLKPEISKELLKFEYFTDIFFSIDGFTKETYEKIRIGASFEKVISHIDYFLKSAETHPVRTSVNLTEQPLNEPEVNDFIFHWVDKVHYVTTSNVAVNGRPTKLFWEPKRAPCMDLWNFMIILTNGKVVPCCRDYLYKFDLGSLSELSLEEIWYGPEYRQLRDLHQQKKWRQIPICNDCDTWMCKTNIRKISYMGKGIRMVQGPFFKMAERIHGAFDIKGHIKTLMYRILWVLNHPVMK